MQRVYQAASLVFLALGVFLASQGLRLSFYTSLGPGPGFFPFWVGLVIGLLAVLWFAQVTLRPVEPMPPGFVPDSTGRIRILFILGALVLLTALLELLGYSLTMMAFLLFLLSVLGRQRPLLTVAISLAGSFGLSYAFGHWLGVHLPSSSILFLQDLGL